MRRIILRFTVAALAFGFGLAVDRVVIFRAPVAPAVKLAEPMSTPADESACDTKAYFALPPDAPTAVVLLDYNPAKFNPTGSFFPLHPLPKEFAEVGYFELNTDEADGKVWGSANIQTHIGKAYEFPHEEFLLLTEKRVFFVTDSSATTGFAYRFEGEFLANPAAEMDSGRAVVKGTLSKMKNGRTIAECEMTFDVKYLGC